MKAVVFLTSIILSANYIGSAQAPPPPPAVADRKTENKWESTEGGFKVRFPAPPKSSVRAIESSFGPTNMYNTELSTALAYYSVLYFDFPTAITDKFDLDTRFDAMRDQQVRSLSARVMHDSELMYGTYYGRANVFETAKETVTMRTFIAGPRLFMLMVVTKGRQSTLGEAVASANAKRIDGFFHSFEIVKLPEARSQQVKLPVDFLVTATKTSLSSAFLGVSITAPTGWVNSAREDSEFVMELGKEEIKRTNPRAANYISNENTRVLGMYTRSDLSTSVPDAFFFVVAEQAPYPNFTPIAVAKTYEKLFLGPTEKVSKPIATVPIGSREFAWMETFDPAAKLYTRLYITNVKGIALEFVMVYSKPEDLQIMLKSLETIKFLQQ